MYKCWVIPERGTMKAFHAFMKHVVMKALGLLVERAEVTVDYGQFCSWSNVPFGIAVYYKTGW